MISIAGLRIELEEGMRYLGIMILTILSWTKIPFPPFELKGAFLPFLHFSQLIWNPLALNLNIESKFDPKHFVLLCWQQHSYRSYTSLCLDSLTSQHRLILKEVFSDLDDGAFTNWGLKFPDSLSITWHLMTSAICKLTTTPVRPTLQYNRSNCTDQYSMYDRIYSSWMARDGEICGKICGMPYFYLVHLLG